MLPINCVPFIIRHIIFLGCPYTTLFTIHFGLNKLKPHQRQSCSTPEVNEAENVKLPPKPKTEK